MRAFTNIVSFTATAIFMALHPSTVLAEDVRLICEAEKDWPYQSGLRIAKQSSLYFAINFDPAGQRGIPQQLNLPCKTAPVGTVDADEIRFICNGDRQVSVFISRLNGNFNMMVGELDAVGSRHYEGRCHLGGNAF